MAPIQPAPKPQCGRRRGRPWLFTGLFLLIAGGVYSYIERPWGPRLAIVAVEVTAEWAHVQVLAVNGRVAARHAVKVRAAITGQAIEVRAEEGASVSAGDSVLQHGVVIFAAPTVDPSTGGRAIKIAFDNPVDLPVGLTVNANIIVSQTDAALSLPRSAIVSEGTQNQVLVLKNGTVAQRPIDFSDWPAERAVVTDGLAAGDVVILDPTAVSVGQVVVAG